MLPPASFIQFTPDLRICRLLNGLWQVSGGHGRIDPVAAIPQMLRYHDAGFTTWDLADHYGPAEDFIGEFRRRLAEHLTDNARIFSFQLDAEDWAQLDAVQAKSRDLFRVIGDCGDEYRR